MHQNCFHTQKPSNGPFSHQNLPYSCSETLPVRSLHLHKSIFSPSPMLASQYQKRTHFSHNSTPHIEIIISSSRWLLLQSQPYSLGFFRRLRAGKYSEPYHQITELFQKFVGLTYSHGYFRVTPRMVFIQGGTVQVWMHEDIFSLSPLFPESTSTHGQHAFVSSFLRILKDAWIDCQPVSNIKTIDAVFSFLETLERTKGSITSKGGLGPGKRSNESIVSLLTEQILQYKELCSGCRSVQELGTPRTFSHLQREVSSSCTGKEKQKQNKLENSNEAPLINIFAPKKHTELPKKVDLEMGVTSELKHTYKKLNLLSTSSTLQKFSQQLRLTQGLKQKDGSEKVLRIKESSKSDLATVPLEQEPVCVADELQGLFGSDIEAAEGPRKSELQKIAQEMEQALFW